MVLSSSCLLQAEVRVVCLQSFSSLHQNLAIPMVAKAASATTTWAAEKTAELHSLLTCAVLGF